MRRVLQFIGFLLVGVLLVTNCENVTDFDSEENDLLSDQATVEIQNSHGSSPIVIYPGNLNGWGFLDESSSGTAEGEFVSGPNTPPFGSGSVRLILDAASEGIIFGKADYLGVRLDEITSLEYSTYRTTGGPALAASLQFNIDNDLTDSDENWKGRLVFEPYYSETVLTGEWQTWDPQTQGRWWGTGSPISSTCPMSSPCTWNEVVNAFPNAGIHSTLGAVLFKAGSGWSEFDGNVDGFTIAINGHEETFDFELEAPDPTTKNDCKKGGWTDYGFKNQGQCIRFVNTGKDSR